MAYVPCLIKESVKCLNLTPASPPSTRPYFDGILKLVNNVPEGELTQQFTISSLMS
jgi:hypothetical protein